MSGIKIPLQDFALQMQGGAYARGGGIFAGHYGSIKRDICSKSWGKGRGEREGGGGGGLTRCDT